MIWYIILGCTSLPGEQKEFTYSTVEKSTSTSYRIGGDGEVKISNGVVGYGDTCNEAAISSGSIVTTETTDVQSVHTLVGATVVDMSDADEEDLVALLYQRTAVSNGLSTELRTYLDYEYTNSDVIITTYTTEELADDIRETEADWYGMTHDTYVKQFTMDQFWSIGNSEVLTKYKPKTGDFWTTNGGRTLHVYNGTVEANVGDETVNADEIYLYEALNNQDNGSGIVMDCFHTRRDMTAYEEDDRIDSNRLRASIDPGCEGNFVHVKTGVQVWYEDLLISEDVEYSEINIRYYGFEQYDSNSSGCERLSQSSIDAAEESNWDTYIEYTVTAIESSTQLEGYKVY